MKILDYIESIKAFDTSFLDNGHYVSQKKISSVLNERISILEEIEAGQDSLEAQDKIEIESILKKYSNFLREVNHMLFGMFRDYSERDWIVLLEDLEYIHSELKEFVSKISIPSRISRIKAFNYSFLNLDTYNDPSKADSLKTNTFRILQEVEKCSITYEISERDRFSITRVLDMHLKLLTGMRDSVCEALYELSAKDWNDFYMDIYSNIIKLREIVLKISKQPIRFELREEMKELEMDSLKMEILRNLNNIKTDFAMQLAELKKELHIEPVNRQIDEEEKPKVKNEFKQKEGIYYVMYNGKLLTDRLKKTDGTEYIRYLFNNPEPIYVFDLYYAVITRYGISQRVIAGTKEPRYDTDLSLSKNEVLLEFKRLKTETDRAEKEDNADTLVDLLNRARKLAMYSNKKGFEINRNALYKKYYNRIKIALDVVKGNFKDDGPNNSFYRLIDYDIVKHYDKFSYKPQKPTSWDT